jgi:hypothetical protein
MSTTKPLPCVSAAEVRKALAPLTVKQLSRLAELSGVPFNTIYKIQRGETKNPGIDTAGAFLPLISAVAAPAEEGAA